MRVFFFSWEDPSGQNVTEEGRISRAGNTLTLTELQPGDSGNYTCVVENLAGRRAKAVWIVVSSESSCSSRRALRVTTNVTTIMSDMVDRWLLILDNM